jgi:hypothetical protein
LQQHASAHIIASAFIHPAMQARTDARMMRYFRHTRTDTRILQTHAADTGRHTLQTQVRTDTRVMRYCFPTRSEREPHCALSYSHPPTCSTHTHTHTHTRTHPRTHPRPPTSPHPHIPTPTQHYNSFPSRLRKMWSASRAPQSRRRTHPSSSPPAARSLSPPFSLSLSLPLSLSRRHWRMVVTDAVAADALLHAWHAQLRTNIARSSTQHVNSTHQARVSNSTRCHRVRFPDADYLPILEKSPAKQNSTLRPLSASHTLLPVPALSEGV